MTKTTSILLVALNLLLVAGFIFVALQVNELHLQSVGKSIESSHNNIGQESILKELEQIKLDIADHKEAIGKLADKFDKLSTKIKEDADSAYVAKPQYTVESVLFTTTKTEKGLVLIMGHKDPVRRWLTDNGLLLEHILTKTLTAQYDSSTQTVHIQDVLEKSYFEQLGLRKGDTVTLIDGLSPKGSDELRQKLTSTENVTLQLKRGSDIYTYKIIYDSIETGEVTLHFSQEQFRSALDRIFSTLRLAPVVQNGKNAGVKILEVDALGVFGAIGFKPQDVIIEIDGEIVTLKGFQNRLKTAEFPLDIKYQREDVLRAVVVKLDP